MALLCPANLTVEHSSTDQMANPVYPTDYHSPDGKPRLPYRLAQLAQSIWQTPSTLQASTVQMAIPVYPTHQHSSTAITAHSSAVQMAIPVYPTGHHSAQQRSLDGKPRLPYKASTVQMANPVYPTG
ncbi:hypothetical protein J6590_010127 [Homalodisca vitripennis]|nr:hypothetical protein J6590_010127 [Homalodisca vitripennis]